MKSNGLHIRILGALTGGSIIAAGAAMATFSFSWFTNTNNLTKDFSGQTIGAYFASGDGSKDNPFIINKPIHLYNLSWLQEIGYFNKVDSATGKISQQYYFEVKANLDMNNWVLPPIGTSTYPFVGNFKGGDYLISNLTISNKMGSETGQIKKHPGSVLSDDFNNNQPNVVGFFGVIGCLPSGEDLRADITVNSVSNFYLDNLKIYTFSSDVLCGSLAGYVNGMLTNAGVHYGNINIAKGTSNISGFSNVSSYTLIGDYNKTDYNWEDDPDGGDIGYGTSTDIKALHNGLINNGLNDGSTGKIKSNYAIPFKSENTTLIHGSGSSITVTTSGSRTQNINPSDYYTYKASTKGNNLGYYVGEVKTYQMSLDYNKEDFGVQSGYVTNVNLKTPPDDVLTYLQTSGTHLIRLNNGYSSDNIAASTFSYVQNGQIGDWTGNLLLPSNGIWVAPKEEGTFKFVFYNASYGKSGSAGSVGILFSELTRVTPGDYSSAFVANSLICTGNSYSCKYGYFEKKASVGKEYYIAFYNTSSYDAPYIAYMDVGTNGGSSTDERTSLKGFDFVEKDSDSNIIKITDANYTNSKVTFTISGTNSTSNFSSYFKRTGQSEVLYYYSPSSSGYAFSVNGTTANAKSDSSIIDEDATSV